MPKINRLADKCSQCGQLVPSGGGYLHIHQGKFINGEWVVYSKNGNYVGNTYATTCVECRPWWDQVIVGRKRRTHAEGNRRHSTLSVNS
jgi:hypothetical protein